MICFFFPWNAIKPTIPTIFFWLQLRFLAFFLAVKVDISVYRSFIQLQYNSVARKKFKKKGYDLWQHKIHFATNLHYFRCCAYPIFLAKYTKIIDSSEGVLKRINGFINQIKYLCIKMNTNHNLLNSGVHLKLYKIVALETISNWTKKKVTM